VNIAIKNIDAAIKCLVWNTSAYDAAVAVAVAVAVANNGSLLVIILDILRVPAPLLLLLM
jgi:hypothetical protein